MRIQSSFLCGLAIVTACGFAAAEDWPTYRHDNRRSGRSAEKIAAADLGPHWVYRSPHPPRPAWAGPAKWDAYRGLRGLQSMRDYDRVFHVIAVGGSVYFGSSVDDAVHCLAAATGKLRWSFGTDGPVRMPPAHHDGRLYFGSDDGRAYCIRASDGGEVWRYSARPDPPLVLNNGRAISFWPIRTGVTVEAGTAYFAAALLPWRESYLCAVDAATGKIAGTGRYAQKLAKLTMEGAMLAAGSALIVPQGRVSPLMFDRLTGRALGGFKGGGGCLVLVTEDSQIYHGPGNKAGWITASSAKQRAKLASFNRGRAMVVAGKTAYLLTDRDLSAIDRSSKNRSLWKVPCTYPHSMIVAGEALIVGGTDEVAAFAAADGKLLWKHRVAGRAYGLAAANGGVFVSTDEGGIYCFRPGGRAVPGGASARKPPPPAAERIAPPTPVTDRTVVGCWVFDRSRGPGGKGYVRSAVMKDARVPDLCGRHDGAVLGEARFTAVNKLHALGLDGKTNSVLIEADHTRANLPTSAITVEAWCRVDAPHQWGGIVGAVQDNGSYEKGWILGYSGSKFSFALAGKTGAKSLGYLPAKTNFVPGRWYHVVGTYDGRTKRIYVNGKPGNASTAQRGEIDYPPKTFFEIGAYHDSNEYYRMQGAVHEVRVYGRVLAAAEIAERYNAKRENFAGLTGPAAPADSAAPADGVYVQFDSPTTATARWRTPKPSPSIIEYGCDGMPRRLTDAKPKVRHAMKLTGLRRNRTYSCVIHSTVGGKPAAAVTFELDTFFNYTLPPAGDAPQAYPAAKPVAAAAKQILSTAGVNRGLCVVINCGVGRLAYELAKRSQLRIIGVDTDAGRVAKARQALRRAGLYGARVSVRHVTNVSKLPLPGRIANLVVVDGPPAVDAKEVLRLLKPGGGVAVSGESKSAPTRWAKITRPPVSDAGQWTHLYGRADNSAFGGESLQGAKSASDLRALWVGRPGPRAQADRNGRKPSHLAIGGRLFYQGLRRIIAVDVCNGSILWSLEIPRMERFNMPRDCSNWCADVDHVFAVVDKQCWRIDAATGAVSKTYDVVAPAKRPGWEYEWGYVARAGGKLFGSAVKKGTQWRNFWGGAGAGWYDAKSGPVTAKVCSENLFAIDPTSGRTAWTYAKGLILNSTITIANGRVYFVECHSPAVKASDSRRVGMAELWQSQYLVALDAATGRRLWDTPIDTADGQVVFYLASGGGKLVIVSSGGKKYHVYAYSAATGKSSWTAEFPWLKDNHGGHMSRPAIVGERLYVRPRVFALGTGKTLTPNMAGGGCGTYAATTGALFFRSGNVTMWDPIGGKSTQWHRLRPDCWLSTIPACGMLLSPEGGGGCSCGSWMETSVGFVPVTPKTK